MLKQEIWSLSVTRENECLSLKGSVLLCASHYVIAYRAHPRPCLV